MRIIQINSGRKWIGEASHTFSLFKELSKRNIFTILICKKGSAIEDFATRENLSFSTLNLSSRFNIISDFKDFLKLRKLIKENKIDIVHTHRGKEHWLAVLTVLTLKNKPKIVRTRHVITSIKRHIFNKWLFGKATNAIICVSKKIYEEVMKTEFIKDREKIKVIYSGIDVDRFKKMGERSESSIPHLYNVPPNALLIGLTGRLQRIKGQEIFLKSAGIISKQFPNTHFLIAGSGKKGKEEKLKALTNELSINDKVTFLGYVNEVEKVIASLDIGVIASLGSEGSSRIAMEYMASGLPIVATKVGGIPEILSDGKYGILVEPNSPEALAEGIITLLNDTEKMSELKKLVRERAVTYFNFDRWIHETVEVYKSIIS